MLADTTTPNDVVIACDVSMITPEQREYWVNEIIPKLYKEVQEIQELPNGWAWRLPSTPEMLILLAEDINMERLCCPFVRYTLEIEPNGGPFWYRMTGVQGVKEFLRMGFESANLFDEQVAKAAGFNSAASIDIDSVATAIDTVDKINERFASATGN